MTTDADSTPDTLTVADAAARAGKSERQVRRWLERGDVAHVRDDKGVRLVVTASLDAWLAARDIRPAPVAEVPGLAELAALLTAEQALRAQLVKDIRDLEWRNAHLGAELARERTQRLLLEAGPVAAPAPDGVTTPDSAPTTTDDGPDSATATDAPGGIVARVRAWWIGYTGR